MGRAFDGSRRFYEEHVRKMIHDLFPAYENRIAVGIAGEGSDCFGYDDAISRDHDYGTGVCLWITQEDFAKIGSPLSIAYNELLDRQGSIVLSERLRERRGVMTINGFYGSVLGAPCDAEACVLSDSDWLSFDKTCLATAVNGEVFRDDLGVFSAFRNHLLAHYPERVWRMRIAEELHAYSASLQVNYARCMARRDAVAAELCRLKGMEAANKFDLNHLRIICSEFKISAVLQVDLSRAQGMRRRAEVFAPHRNACKDEVGRGRLEGLEL